MLFLHLTAVTTFYLYTLLIFPYNNVSQLKCPSCADVPLPILSKVAAGAALHIQINMTCLAGSKCRADTIFKPGIVKSITSLHTVSAVMHRHIITAAKLVQQICFRINDPLTANLFTDIETNASDSTLDPALVYLNAIAGSIVIAAQIA